MDDFSTDIPVSNEQAKAYGHQRGLAGISLNRFLDEIGARDSTNSSEIPAAVPGPGGQELLIAYLAGFAAGQEEQVQDVKLVANELEQLNQELLEQTQSRLPSRVAELDALHKVNSAVNSSLDLDAVLNLTVEVVAEVMKSDVCTIYLYDPSRDVLVLRATKGLNEALAAEGEHTLPLGLGVTGWAAKMGKSIAVRDIWSDPHFRYHPGLNEEPYHSLLSVPLILYSMARLIGVINVQTIEYRDYSQEEINFLEMVAGELAISVENARLYQMTDEKLRQKVVELTTLQRVSAAIAATLDITEVLNLIASQAVELSTADMSAIFSINEQTGLPVIMANSGMDQRIVEEILSQPSEGLINMVVQQGTTIAVTDVLSDDRVSSAGRLAAEDGYRSILCLPLISQQKILGGICLYAKGTHAFNQEELQLLTSFANEAAIAVENARLYEEARHGLEIKSTLLQEMHHRVRNNLQTVGALLSMALRRARNTEAEGPLGESVARIQSIAAVHDLLSGERLSQTTVFEITKKVVETACSSLLPPGRNLEVEIGEADVVVGSREATLVAIVINELIANAIRHAFNDGQAGSILITARNRDNKVRIQVADNGQGCPPDFDLKDSTGLGLQIVQTLVCKDLKGEFWIESSPAGTTSVIEFQNDSLAKETISG